jgi:hypothetical protein
MFNSLCNSRNLQADLCVVKEARLLMQQERNIQSNKQAKNKNHFNG